MFADKQRPGRFIAQLKVDGKLHRDFAWSEDAAWDLLEEMVRKHRAGIDLGVNPTVEEYVAAWIAVADVRDSTRRAYVSHASRHIYPHIGSRRLSRLTPLQLRQLFGTLAERGLAPRTVRQVRAILSGALAQAGTDGLVTRNAAALTRPPKLPNVEKRTLTPDEARAFLASVRGQRLEPAYLLALTLGLRQGELLGLRWEDVDLEAGTLHVRKNLQRVGGAYQLIDPKTPRSVRDLPLPPGAVALLRALRTTQSEEWLRLPVEVRPQVRLVFMTPNWRPVSGSWLTHDLARRLDHAGLPRVSFHDLRHAAASLMHEQGFSAREVQDMLGHATYLTTMNVYTHVPEASLRSRVERLEEALEGRAEGPGAAEGSP